MNSKSVPMNTDEGFVTEQGHILILWYFFSIIIYCQGIHRPMSFFILSTTYKETLASFQAIGFD